MFGIAVHQSSRQHHYLHQHHRWTWTQQFAFTLMLTVTSSINVFGKFVFLFTQMVFPSQRSNSFPFYETFDG